VLIAACVDMNGRIFGHPGTLRASWRLFNVSIRIEIVWTSSASGSLPRRGTCIVPKDDLMSERRHTEV